MRVAMLVLLFGCNGGKDATDHDANGDADADTDADADSDADTDVDRCAPLTPPSDAIPVAEGEDLAAAVAAAPDGAVLALAAGTWVLSAPLTLDHPVTLVSADADAASVTLDGDYVASNLVQIASPDVTVAHLTLTRSFDDLLVVAPGSDRATVHGVSFVDSARYGLVATSDWDAGTFTDDGVVSCSSFALTDAGRDEVRGECVTGGVDLYGVRGWTVRDDTFDDFWCPFGVSGPGIRATRGVRDTVITRNVLRDVAFGIVLGETQDQIGRVYDDLPCGTAAVLQSVDGVVTNNLVSAYDDDLLVSDGGVLTGIRTESSCEALVAHNSVYAGVTPVSSSIEQRYDTTTGLVANNLLSDKAIRTDGALADVAGNLETVQFDTWLFPAGNDFHTSPGASWAIDQGDVSTLGLVIDDIDGELRSDGQLDIGADEQ